MLRNPIYAVRDSSIFADCVMLVGQVLVFPMLVVKSAEARC